MHATWSLAMLGSGAASSRISPHIGPQLRSPAGGNLHAATAAAASLGVLIMGTITPAAPESNARMIIHASRHGVRTSGWCPAARAACSVIGDRTSTRLYSSHVG